MSDMGTKIMASGLIDEGIKFEEMEKELKELRLKLENKMPVFPYCLTEMEPFDYKGYYDIHYGWSCNCDSIPNATEWRGNYA